MQQALCFLAKFSQQLRETGREALRGGGYGKDKNMRLLLVLHQFHGFTPIVSTKQPGDAASPHSVGTAQDSIHSAVKMDIHLFKVPFDICSVLLSVYDVDQQLAVCELRESFYLGLNLRGRFLYLPII